MRTDAASGGGSAEARSPGAGAERPGDRSCVLIRITPELRPEIPWAGRRVLAVATDRRAVDERYQRPRVDPDPIGTGTARCGCFVPRIAVDASEVELETGRLGDVAHEPLGCTAVAFTERVRLEARTFRSDATSRGSACFRAFWVPGSRLLASRAVEWGAPMSPDDVWPYNSGRFREGAVRVVGHVIHHSVALDAIMMGWVRTRRC